MNLNIELPPEPSGNNSEDIKEIYSFLYELIDELEYVVRRLSNNE